MAFKLTTKFKFGLFALLIILNIILRFQVAPYEIGEDSFSMHIMANSLSEFGYAKWLLHPLSLFGLYPASYTSSMQFLISGISQSIGIEMESTILLYCLFIGLLSIFTIYLLAGEIINDDLFKMFVAFGFSTSPAILGYSTLTIPTRGLFIVLAPLLLYIIFKSRKSIKYLTLASIFSILLLTTHHLFYFLIPAFMAFFILMIYSKFKNLFLPIKIPEKLFSPLIIISFILMFSIPFITGRFIENSRYSSIDVSYIRYIGILIIFSIGGLGYLVFKHNKKFGEWFLILTLVMLTIFVYQQTYMKWFMPIFAILLAGIGLLNIIKFSKNKKYYIIFIFLILSIIFSGYFQFLNTYRENPFNERYIEESTFRTGKWMKANLNGSSVSNDYLFSLRILATSESAHLLTSSTVLNQIYGFNNINMSEYKKYPITKEDFWFSGYEGPDIGEYTWFELNNIQRLPRESNISYVIENRKGKGNIISTHGLIPSLLIVYAYKKDQIFDNGNISIWKLNQDFDYGDIK